MPVTELFSRETKGCAWAISGMQIKSSSRSISSRVKSNAPSGGGGVDERSTIILNAQVSATSWKTGIIKHHKNKKTGHQWYWNIALEGGCKNHSIMLEKRGKTEVEKCRPRPTNSPGHANYDIFVMTHNPDLPFLLFINSSKTTHCVNSGNNFPTHTFMLGWSRVITGHDTPHNTIAHVSSKDFIHWMKVKLYTIRGL